MKKFEVDLAKEMQDEMRKQASAKQPDLTKAAECLHAALEILEAQGLTARAEQVLEVLRKIAVDHKTHVIHKMPTVQQLMERGLTQRDMQQFAQGNPIAKAKFNLVLSQLGLSDHDKARFIGHKNVMSEEDAKAVADPNRMYGKMWDWMKDPTQPIDPANPTTEENIGRWLQDPTAPIDPNNPQPGETISMKSAGKKFRTPRPGTPDRHTKGLTSKKMIENLKNHGTEFNMADDNDTDEVDLANFDFNASDDELMGLEVDDTLEVFDGELADFEDEKR